MKIKVEMVVEVDRAAVEAEYGEFRTAAEIREWVRSEAITATESALRQVDAKVQEA